MIEQPSVVESKPRARSHWPLWIGTGIFIFILASTVVWTQQQQSGTAAERPSTARIGSVAPEIKLALLESGHPGKQVTLSSLQGRPVVVNFWATWCNPCRAEFPAIESKYRQYKDSQQLVVVGVDSDGDDGPAAAASFVNKMGVTFPIWLDTDGSAEQTYRVNALPTTVFIDRHGVIQDMIVGGPIKTDYLEKELRKIF